MFLRATMFEGLAVSQGNIYVILILKVISHKNYGSREEFDEALHLSLIAAGVEIVCLAGFMRILTGTCLSYLMGLMK